jgi:transcriptional regulator with XRE-family HTH domain
MIGTRIRSLRNHMGLSLRDLAERAGVSAPMLSQVERGETSPTLVVAGRIAEGLDLSLSQLLRLDEAPPVEIVRVADRHPVANGGHVWELLTPDLPGARAAVSRHTLAPGAATGGAPMHEPGSRVVAVAESGTLRLEVDGAGHELAAGDAVTFDADLPHRFSNPGAVPAVFVSVVTAGLRRS